MAINFDGVNSWLDYSDKIQKLADEVKRFINNFRSQLSQKERDMLKDYEERLRVDARTIATIVANDLLTRLQPQLDALKAGIEKADGFLQSFNTVKDAILAITEVFTALTNVLDLLNS
ncbi:hypothetical protein [Nostoc sp. UIC 10630]|uniref:hypothetical protein n=1 Tax=Nostoc sp. UIC 10630 TaxID=2100146 RepID=UPI0013D85AE8|nr:hypothetical protein [Nostoc sp. UIC 10630]NEU81970.1 hypothetical protein [Nostoc sp. UIC 10630]